MADKRVVFIVETFPIPADAFIINEILAVQEAGVDVVVYAYQKPKKAVVLPLIERIRSLRYFGDIKSKRSRNLCTAHIRAFWRNPSVYIGELLLSLKNRSVGNFFDAVTLSWDLNYLELDHVHVHFTDRFSNVAWITSRLISLPMSLTYHGGGAVLFADFANRVNRGCRVVTVSEFARRELEVEHKIPFQFIDVVPCGVNTDLFKPVKKNRNRFRILNVGRLSPVKNQALIISMCKKLRGRGVEFECTIVGEGRLRSFLQGKITSAGLDDCVALVGALDQQQIADLLSETDVFVFPSHSETLGVALLEAMACAVPVVASNVGSIPTFVEDGVSGLIVNESNVDAYVGCVEKLFYDPVLRRELGERGKAVVESRFELNANVELLLALWFGRVGALPPASVA